jgi:hypothetical protein
LADNQVDRDKNKTYTLEEEAEFDRQGREHHASHKDRDAAAAGAGAGELYASDKHHYAGQTDASKSGPTASGIGSSTQNTRADNNTSSSQAGRDAAVGSGAVGAAGVAKHEHNKHSGPTPLAEKPKGKDLGDILHGVERNRGVPGSSGYAGTEGYGTGTGGALPAKEAPQTGISEATTNQAGAPLPLDADHELGARLAGHKKSDSGYAAGGNDYKSSSTLPGSKGLHGDHVTRKHDPALGLMGITESRLSEPSSTTSKQDTTSGAVGSNARSDFLASNTTGVGKIGDGRNRLHKDPPAGHSASQDGSSHVPASKSEREKMVSEGEGSIDKDSGVANSHAAGGANAASNY